MAVGTDGFVHVAFSKFAGGVTSIGYRRSATPPAETLLPDFPSALLGPHSSLAHDGTIESGKLHLRYYLDSSDASTPRQRLEYAWVKIGTGGSGKTAGAAWNSTVVEGGGGGRREENPAVGKFCSLARGSEEGLGANPLLVTIGGPVDRPARGKSKAAPDGGKREQP